MTFSDLRNHAEKEGFAGVNFIFANTIGTTLHGEWIDPNHFTIYESPSEGIIAVDDWIRLGGESFHYVPITK